MKKLYPFLLSLLFILSNTTLFAQCTGTLVWSDEFNGSSLDLSKWAYQTGNGCPSLCGWGNSELEYYTNSTNNVYLTGGNLVLEAKAESISGSSFSSGKIVTLGKASWTYGRFEARMRLPKGNGLWPAFWMLSTSNNWPMTGEIDIMENRGDVPALINGTLHYGSPWPNNQNDGNAYTLPSGDFSSQFHVLSVEWDPNEIRWYVDSTRFKTETRIPNSLNPASTDNVWPWTSDFYIILNLAVGGWYTGVTDPAVVQLTKPTFEIDYVRVYDISASSAYQVPYSGIPKALPALVQAEEYDKGCGDAAYYDTDLPNNGGVFRTEKVDIEATTDAGGGYDIGWIATGEWLEYTVSVPSSGNYNFAIRAASNAGGGKMHIEIDGVDVTGIINIGATGGWQTWQNFSVTNIPLTAGVKTMKVYFDNAGMNLNYINISSASLPVVLIDYKASLAHGEVNLEWITAAETNNSFFIIDRSADGQNWNFLRKVPGTNTTSVAIYRETDQQPYQGTSYYRLVQQDLDGTAHFLGMVSVASSLEAIVYKNMGNIIVKLPSGSTSMKELRLYDLMGKPVNVREEENDNEINLYTRDLPSAVYFLKIMYGDQYLVKKIVLE
jgi:beta-glucanase (GH16 family)